MAVDKQLATKTHPFQLNQKVEIKTFEVGFEGSWHMATIVLSDERCFHVKYDHALFLDDGPERIVEVISPLPGSISTRLRPIPPPATCGLLGFTYGLCVDVWRHNAWWEAVVADHLNQSDQRIVFLMDSCREIRVRTDNMRVTQDWESSAGVWRRRGNWPLIQWIGLSVNGPTLLPDQESDYGGLEIGKLETESEERQDMNTTPFSHNAGEETKGKKRRSWEPVGSDLLAGPEFCPRFVTEYASFGPDKRPPETAVMGVRKHLAALGWKIEYKKEKTAYRFRYISPGETLTYFSLRLLCQDLREPVRGNSQTPKRNKRNREPDTNSDSERCTKKRSKLDNQCHEEEGANSDCEFGWASSPDSVLRPLRASVSTRSQQQKKKTLIPDEECGVGSTTGTVRIKLNAARKACLLLSTLIDTNLYLLDAEVRCHSKNILKKGILKRDGIHCRCCNKCYSLAGFESHSGSKKHRPAASIFLEDGKSLSECYGKILKKRRRGARKKKSEELEEEDGGNKDPNDLICSVCRDVGDLLCCDSCPSSFHHTCVGLEKLPDGDWFCPFCCCDICGQLNCGDSNDDQLLSCDHCQLKFHGGCLTKKGFAEPKRRSEKRNWFCSVECGTVFSGLQGLVGKPISVGEDDLTWTLLRLSEEESSETRTKLSSAIDVLHECFKPFKDNFSGTDIVEDLTFSKRSDLQRLNFQRFYTIVIQRRGEVMSSANVRLLGKMLAEMPLIGTRFQYRGQGLCRVLLNELEKQLKKFGVEKLLLPAAHSVLDMWRDTFGFSELGSEDRKLVGCRFMEIEGTVTCQKLIV